jgi:PAS domain S-box-containing protein
MSNLLTTQEKNDNNMPTEQCQTYLSESGELKVPLFENSLDCIKIMDLDGRLRQLNPGASEALELDDPTVLHGMQWQSFWPEESRHMVAQSVTSALTGERTQFSGFCPTAKGAPRWWDVVVYPIRDARGDVCEIMAISRDVTELCLAREALREAARQKDEFLLILAHELRNPLSAAAMAATILEKQPVDATQLKKYAQFVSRQISHMSTLIEDLVDLARVARGEVRLKLAALDMRTVVSDAIEQLHPLSQSKRHTLSLDEETDACIVQGDRVRLIQALGNLLGNAVRYTPPEGHIQIIVRRQHNEVHTTVRDNGIGITAVNMPRIFDRYMQIDRSSDRESSGLGLGLSLVSKLAELHGGRVTAASEGENKGSTFTLILPVTQ